MDKKIIKLDGADIEEYKFHQNKNPISINNININKIAPNKIPFGKQDFKCFIGYKYSLKIRPLCIFRLQMIIYKRYFDENRRIFFLIKKKKFLLNKWKF